MSLTFRSVFRAFALTIAALTIVVGSAQADALTPEDVAALVGQGKVAADISSPRVSPDGKHFSFLHDAHLRYENPPPYDTPAPPCSDVWVARADGTELTRLTKTCDYRGTYESRGGGGDWSPDGAVLTWYSDYVKGSARSTRWTLAIEADGRDTWTANAYVGYGASYTSDQRYWIVRFQRAVGAGQTFSAVDLATGTVYPVWTTWYPGDGRWSEACAGAPAPAGGWEPTLAEVDAALTGSDPACTFAAKPKPVEPPVTSADPAPTSPLAVAAPTPAILVPAPVSPAGAAAPASAAQLSSLPVQLLAVTSSLKRARALGITIKFAAPGATSVRAWVLRGDVVIARGSTSTIGSSQLQLAPGRALRALRLDAKKPLRLTVRLAVTDSQGRRSVLDRPLALRP